MKRAQHANSSQLQMLLYGEEDSLPNSEIARHVESCAQCQQQLTKLASLETTELEVHQLLGEIEAPDPTRDLTHSSGFEVERGPPSHPEMLGRLGRYEIERMFGSGGMGVVFKGVDTELNRPVAIKVLAPHLARSGAAKQRFGRESRAAAAVVHEHVVAIHNVQSDGATPFIVMQYVCGESLQARVERLGPLSAQQILRIGIQAASGLAAAHEQGIVHRDVKPANILLEDGVERVLLTDFGLARTVDDASLTHTGLIAGTPNYMSPEQANGNPVDYRSDLFSLGSVLYFVATGHPPFRAERAMGVLNRICHEPHRAVWRVNADIPNDLSVVMDRLLEKRPSKRFPSALAVRDTLTRILQTLQNRRPSMSSRLHAWTRYHRNATLAGAASIALLASTFGAFQAGWLRSLQPTAVRPPAVRQSLTSGPIETAGSDRPVEAQADTSSSMLLEIDTQDRAAFTQEIRELHQSLDNFQSRRSPPPTPIDWQSELGEIHHSLDQLDSRQ